MSVQCPPVAATHNRNLLQNDAIYCRISELVKHIILSRRQNGLSAQHDVGQLWHVYLVVFQHCTSLTRVNPLAYQYGAFICYYFLQV